MRVLKFGGSSVGSAENIRRVARIVQSQNKKSDKIVVVVSAFAGITDQLQRLSEAAPAHDPGYEDILADIEQRHTAMIKSLMPEALDQGLSAIDPFLKRLKESARGAYLLRECSPRIHDLILGFGERFSATVIAVFFKSLGMDARFQDASSFLISDDRFGGARINIEQSHDGIRQAFAQKGKIHVVTGFIASTTDGVLTTLGRGGSDYTAAVLASALEAPEVQIWTDVNGVMTANPAVVRDARPLSAITYQEAMELSHFGAGVLYPPTIQPAMEKNISIRILNTFDTSFPGTVINREGGGEKCTVTGITAIHDIALLTIEGSGMVGVPGIAARLFDLLAVVEINIILITQASSEHSICVALNPADVGLARRAIENGFRHEIKAREMDKLKVQKALSILAVVGQNMRHVPGIAARLFQALGQNGINVYAIAQGSSELNVSVALDKKLLNRALNVVHGAFISGKHLPVFLIGCGGVGAELLLQIQALKANAPLVCGLANSRKMYIDGTGIDLNFWREGLNASPKKMNAVEFLDAIPPGGVLVDCTADEEISGLYEKALRRKISVVAANKIAFAQSFKRYETLHELARNSGVALNYEATVGAGLPVISTFRMLRRCGDTVRKVEAVLSGSLGFIFSRFNAGGRFSETVKQAREAGFTEPDPRLDLNGTDVARKILIIARECSVQAGWADIKQEGFLPQECVNAPDLDTFFKRLEDADAYFDKLRNKAVKSGNELCYSAVFDSDGLRAGLDEIGPEHPFYRLGAGESMLVIHSRNYNKTPLIIRGMGAGASVTASAVLNDIAMQNS